MPDFPGSMRESFTMWAAAICDGELLGLVTKTNMPNYSEFYELRHFTPGMEIPVLTDWLDTRVPDGNQPAVYL